ncbi:MAG: carboxypeptidase regulatory-like domain-containing protein [Acidobacteriaceae bacterium]
MWKFIRTSLVIAVLMTGVLGYAQSTNSGDLSGTVTDTTGAVIPGVTVTVKDVTKDVTHTYMTNNAGVYDTGAIVADEYLVTFAKEGFKTLVRGPITLTVGSTTLNATLNVGAATQKITVTTSLPLLNTSTGSQTDTLNAQTMQKLPQTGSADWENFIWLQPGTAGSPENASTSNTPGMGAVSVNGNLPYATTLQDGATTTLPMSSNSNTTIFETTSEVKISKTAFSAQYGLGNIVYNQITKGGSNKFHGVGYEYFQNNALNAAPYAFGQHASVPFLRYNNFGFSVSGPIVPHHAYFYFDYDKTIDNGGAANGFITVPSPAIMSGDFTAPGLPTLYDPTNQTIQQTGTYTYMGSQYPGGSLTVTCPCVIRPTFISEYGSNKIPAQMISAVAQKIEAYYPKANATGQVSGGYAQNNYFYNTPSSNPLNRYFGRLDWDITQNNRLTITDTEADNPATYLNQGLCPINCQSGDVSNVNSSISDVWTFSANLINQANFGFTDQLNFFQPYTLNQGFPAKLGWQFAKADNFPNIGIGGFYGLGSSTNAVYKEFVFDPSDVVTLIRGRHVLHFGGEFLVNRADATAWGNINAGSMGYNGDYTSAGGAVTAPYDGFSYADFLLGQTQNWNAGVTPEYGGRWKSPQLFVQDDYKMRPNLTINLGLRWEGETGWSEVHGNMASFDPNVINPANNMPGAMWYGTTHANGRTQLQKPKWNIFLPRFGFSYEPMANTVIRGGFGIFAAGWSEDTYGAGMGGEFGSSGGYTDTTNGICPVVQLDSNGQSPDTADPGCGVAGYNPNSIDSFYLTAPTGAASRNGAGYVPYNPYHTPVPTNYQWTIALQRQLGLNYSAQISYVGNHGDNLPFPGDYNQVPQSKLGPNDAQYQPYPIFNYIGGSTNNAISNYNALQAMLNKRMNDGLQFEVNYTWSHFLDEQDSSGWGSRGGYQSYQNFHDPRANYGNSNFDIRNMLKGEVVYELPFGKGRMFLNKNMWLDEAVGGWQTAVTFVAQSGNPFTLTTAFGNTSNNQSGPYTQYPNIVGNYQVTGSRQQRLLNWYNTNAFAVPAAYTYGDFRRNTISGPGLSEVNMSLGKTFALWPAHNVNFELRANATNVLNHPSFGQPGTTIAPAANQPSIAINGVTVGGRAMELYGRISF